VAAGAGCTTVRSVLLHPTTANKQRIAAATARKDFMALSLFNFLVRNGGKEPGLHPPYGRTSAVLISLANQLPSQQKRRLELPP
jgi:hypothetical protein